MSKIVKEIVCNFYFLDILKDKIVLKKFFYLELIFIWNSSDGFFIKNYDDLV